MKKIVLLITILFVSVISTACINNLAVQELNNKAKEYMANGEIEKAICRLRSSIDLDTSIFETHYNLGVALIEAKEYKEAQESLQNAIKLKPDFVDSYYSLAVAQEGEADSIINPKDSDDGDSETEDAVSDGQNTKTKLSDTDKTKVVELYTSAVDNYNKYLAKQPDAQDKEKIVAQIDYLNSQIKKYTSERNTSLPAVDESAQTQVNE